MLLFLAAPVSVAMDGMPILYDGTASSVHNLCLDFGGIGFLQAQGAQLEASVWQFLEATWTPPPPLFLLLGPHLGEGPIVSIGASWHFGIHELYRSADKVHAK